MQEHIDFTTWASANQIVDSPNIRFVHTDNVISFDIFEIELARDMLWNRNTGSFEALLSTFMHGFTDFPWAGRGGIDCYFVAQTCLRH